LSFRSIVKEPIPGQAPPEICDAIRIRAASERRSHSEVATEILSIGLGIDPLQFGIRPDAHRPRRRDAVHSN
jgi:hypothetical protein